MSGLRAGAAVILLLAAGAAPRASDPITPAVATALDAWVRTVHSHTPGKADAAVLDVLRYSYATRVSMNAGMDLFLRAATGRSVRSDRSPQAVAVVDLGRKAGLPFLTRAAMLHGDVAIYRHSRQGPQNAGERDPVASDSGADDDVRSGAPRDVPPLLHEDPLVLTMDGELLGGQRSDWNWYFARSLLDALHAAADDRVVDAFILRWYHATAAHLFAAGSYGELTPHLRQASGFGDDALILFDRGCYAELWGLPIHQALRPDREPEPPRPGVGRTLVWQQPAAPAVDVPAAAVTNADAERLFRRALEADPHLSEARVRLVRLLTVRGRYADALREAARVLEDAPEPSLAFYAHLFAGRAAQELHRLDEAAAHDRAALSLFPHAQSALLASSQVALLSAQVDRALAPLDRLGGETTTLEADPWWRYDRGPGRNAAAILQALWAEPLR